MVKKLILFPPSYHTFYYTFFVSTGVAIKRYVLQNYYGPMKGRNRAQSLRRSHDGVRTVSYVRVLGSQDRSRRSSLARFSSRLLIPKKLSLRLQLAANLV